MEHKKYCNYTNLNRLTCDCDSCVRERRDLYEICKPQKTTPRLKLPKEEYKTNKKLGKSLCKCGGACQTSKQTNKKIFLENLKTKLLAIHGLRTDSYKVRNIVEGLLVELEELDNE